MAVGTGLQVMQVMMDDSVNEVLGAHAGRPVTGKAAVVQAPLAPLDGILVGDSPTDSIFVDLADPLPDTPTQPPTAYQPGQKVNFTGKLVANTPEYITEAATWISSRTSSRSSPAATTSKPCQATFSPADNGRKGSVPRVRTTSPQRGSSSAEPALT